MQLKITDARRIIIKIGTSVITDNNSPNTLWLRKKIGEISALQKKGKEIIVITSGAVGTGMKLEGLKTRPKEPIKLQLLSGKGQAILMGIYVEEFAKHCIQTAQVLLTHHNFSSKEDVNNIKSIIEEYAKEGTIPIINTNDVITKEEFMSNSIGRFTDNDELSALVASSLNANLLLILTDVDGLFTADPRKEPDAEFIPEVKKITEDIIRMASKESNSLGKGGMLSKVITARDVANHGVMTIVANGKYNIDEILSGRVKRTVFFGNTKKN